MKKILISGIAGFIGFHLGKRLLDEGISIIGIDNLNEYYDVNLKKDRLKFLIDRENFQFFELDIANDVEMRDLSTKIDVSVIVNLAAQAGVQYSSVNPHAYIDSNLRGFLNILELSKFQKVKHFVYASSSSVYGMNHSIPFRESDNVDHPISLYAATKRSNELIAHSYSHLFDLPSTGLRFFTVYGPWGRPDMALFKFTNALINNDEININNFGNHYRDFTFIDDIIDGITLLINKPPQEGISTDIAPNSSPAKWKVFNIGRGEKVYLLDFIRCIEDYFGKSVKKNLVPLQPGDVPTTFSDTSELRELFGYNPKVSIKEGVKKFLDWYVDYYNIKLPL